LAAIKATETVYQKTPDLTREGGSSELDGFTRSSNVDVGTFLAVPIILTFEEELGKNILLLPSEFFASFRTISETFRFI
jgi:hypothetical protein